MLSAAGLSTQGYLGVSSSLSLTFQMQEDQFYGVGILQLTIY